MGNKSSFTVATEAKYQPRIELRIRMDTNSSWLLLRSLVACEGKGTLLHSVSTPKNRAWQLDSIKKQKKNYLCLRFVTWPDGMTLSALSTKDKSGKRENNSLHTIKMALSAHP